MRANYLVPRSATHTVARTSMRLLFVSDLHYSLKQFDWLLAHASGYDLAVIGGDLLDLSSPLDADVQIAIVEKYLRLLQEKSRIVVCSGNHDGDTRNVADESVAAWIRAARTDRLRVDGEGFEEAGIRFSVCPWWDGDTTRAELEAFLVAESALVRDRWIWIYHAPPEGARTSWSGRKFIGDTFLRGWIERFRPEAVLSGHIHNSPFYDGGSWIDQIGSTWVFNPGRQLGPQPTTITLDLANRTAEWNAVGERLVRDLRTAQG